MLAENRIATDLRILGVTTVFAGVLTANSDVLAKPTLWRRSVSLRVRSAAGAWSDVLLRTYEFCRSYWPNLSVSAPAPLFYADKDFSTFTLVGPPSTALNYELTYVAKVPALDVVTLTNWFTINAPQLLLAALLLECEIWLRNQNRIPQREDIYQKSLAAFKAEDATRALDRSVVLL